MTRSFWHQFLLLKQNTGLCACRIIARSALSFMDCLFVTCQMRSSVSKPPDAIMHSDFFHLTELDVRFNSIYNTYTKNFSVPWRERSESVISSESNSPSSSKCELPIAWLIVNAIPPLTSEFGLSLESTNSEVPAYWRLEILSWT